MRKIGRSVPVSSVVAARALSAAPEVLAQLAAPHRLAAAAVRVDCVSIGAPQKTAAAAAAAAALEQEDTAMHQSTAPTNLVLRDGTHELCPSAENDAPALDAPIHHEDL